MKRRLSYTACKDGHYVVMCGKTALGCIEPKGQIFKKRMVFQEDVFDGAEWTGECLVELGIHMLSLEKRGSVSRVQSLCKSCNFGDYCAVRRSYKLEVIECCHYEKNSGTKPVS